MQEAIRQICLATSGYGVESKVFALSPNPIPKVVLNGPSETVRSKSWMAPASCDIGGFDSIAEFLNLAEWADVIHFHFPWPFGDILNFFRRANKPAVITYHSDIVRQRVLNMVYRPLMLRTIRSMAAVVATSPAYAKTSPVLLQDVPSDKLHTIPLGIVDRRDTSIQSEDGSGPVAGESVPFVLAIGVLRYYKGLHTLIQAALEIKGQIVIAGSGPEGEALKELAQRLGAHNVTFLGQVTEERRDDLLRQCRAVVFPSHMRSEAFGMVLVEASMFSKPMVCCEVGSGTSFVNEDGVTGLVVPPESPQEFASACNRLLTDQRLAKKMGDAARARYERLFSGEALGGAYCNLYRLVCIR
ncbi:glycosyltransferase [Rhodoferax sp. GW822-FHT02A01]|uniref:glycosyltransferase n=1 Tax=Rhodoferax sp. GW822-FHT02A01 TaxID=3141537 RepID=UPI00315CBA31